MIFQYFITNHSAFRTNPNVAAIRERYAKIRFHSIQILMSIISLPYHYEHLQQNLFEDFFEKSFGRSVNSQKHFLIIDENFSPRFYTR